MSINQIPADRRSNVHFFAVAVSGGKEYSMGGITVWNGRAAGDEKLNGCYPRETKTNDRVRAAARWLTHNPMALEASVEAKGCDVIWVRRLTVPVGTTLIKHF